MTIRSAADVTPAVLAVMEQTRNPRLREIMLSLAGRTKTPAAQPVPVRVGGFGGAEGLARFIREQEVDLTEIEPGHYCRCIHKLTKEGRL